MHDRLPTAFRPGKGGYQPGTAHGNGGPPRRCEKNPRLFPPALEEGEVRGVPVPQRPEGQGDYLSHPKGMAASNDWCACSSGRYSWRMSSQKAAPARSVTTAASRTAEALALLPGPRAVRSIESLFYNPSPQAMPRSRESKCGRVRSAERNSITGAIAFLIEPHRLGRREGRLWEISPATSPRRLSLRDKP